MRRWSPGTPRRNPSDVRVLARGTNAASLAPGADYARSPITAIAWISISMPERAKFVTVMRALAG